MYCLEYGLRYIYLVFSVGTQTFTVLKKMAGCSCFSVGRDECARQRFRIVGGGILMASVCVFIHVFVCVCGGGGSVNLRSSSFPTALPSLQHKRTRTCVCAEFNSVGSSEFGIKKRVGSGGAHNNLQ